MSYPEFRYLASESRTFTALSATRASSVSLEASGAVRSTVMNGVSGNYFALLGVPMAHGRGFLPEEDREGAPRSVVVLSYRLWQTRFGADPAIVGRPVLVNDAPYLVVGVTPPEFTGSSTSGIQLWVPIAAIPALRPHDPGERDILTQVDCCVNVVGRLAPGVSRRQAEAELQVLSGRFRERAAVRKMPLIVGGTQFMRGGFAANDELAVMAVLFAGLVLVLLLACANVGNLVLARAAARSGEIDLRLSLGAGRRRIVRQLLTEGLVLALLASAAGFVVAMWVPDLVLTRLAGQPVPFDIEPDLSVVLYAFTLAGVACVTFALAPALHATRHGAMASLRQATAARSTVRMRSGLLGVQVAITVILLTSAGLLLRGVNQASTIDPGFRVSGLWLATFELPEAAYDNQRARAFLDDLTNGLREAGIGAFGFTATEPFGGRFTLAGFRKPGEAAGVMRAINFMSVSPDYFATLRIPIVAGRRFEPADAGQGVAIVNETAARRHWPGQDVVGQTLIVGRDATFRVIGVVRDAHLETLGAVEPLLFLHLTAPPADDFARLVFDAAEPSAAATVAAVVAGLDRRARVEIRPLQARVDEVLAELALAPLAASVLGFFGLALATIGMFGMFGYVVRQRTREIGIRIALGARAADIVRLVVAGSSRPVIVGLAVGILGAVGASQPLRSQLFGVSALDPLTYAGVALLLGTAAMAASYVPARRAVRLNPTHALRE
jgi:predicted permease